MMPKITLATYTLRIRKESSSTPLVVSEFSENSDFYHFMERYLDSLKAKISHDANEKKLLRVIDYGKTGRILSGLIESGSYGFTSRLYDVGMEVTSYRRKTNEAELLPFFFLFDITRGFNEAIVILQRFSNSGIRKVLLEDLRHYFRDDFPGFTVDINPLVPESFYEEYLEKGRVTKIRFKKFSVDPNIENNFDSHDHNEQFGYTELVVTAFRNKKLPILKKIRSFQKGERGVRELFDIQFFPYDNIQIEMVKNGNKRTLDLSEMNRIRAYFDVSKEIKYNVDGHPEVMSLEIKARELLKDLKIALKRG